MIFLNDSTNTLLLQRKIKNFVDDRNGIHEMFNNRWEWDGESGEREEVESADLEQQLADVAIGFHQSVSVSGLR